MVTAASGYSRVYVSVDGTSFCTLNTEVFLRRNWCLPCVKIAKLCKSEKTGKFSPLKQLLLHVRRKQSQRLNSILTDPQIVSQWLFIKNN